MKNQRNLNIKGAVLDKKQLESYLEKIASDHILTNISEKNTYPIPRLKDNFNYIFSIYNLLNEHLKLGIAVHPAGEWILDNFYIIEKTVKTIIKELPLKKYTDFLGISNGPYKGFARIYVLASEIVAYTDGQISEESLSDLLSAYQNKKTLNMEEIWNIGLFMQISLIEKIRGICEKIYSSQMQKYTVENIIERLVENKQKLKFKNIPVKTQLLGYGQMKYPFIEYMSYRLKSYGKKAYGYMQILEDQVDKMGTDIYDVIQKEHFDIAVKKISLGNAITSINTLMRMNFQVIFEKINGVEEILKLDPAGVYDNMDYKTKAYYRNQIEKLSNKTKISEIYIAKKCIELAQKSVLEQQQQLVKQTHIGYYLIDKGKEILISQLLNKPIKPKIDKAKLYISSIFIITFLIAALVGTYVKTQLFNHLINETISWIVAIIIGIFSILPIQNIVAQIIQYILSKIVKPKLIPKLDFQNGIPEEYSTMVVIPTIIKNKEKVEELYKKLEVFYIANKSENLYFTLLGDCSSSKNEIEPFDDEVIKEGLYQIEKLNKKYQNIEDESIKKFNFIYRNRIWNPNEECFLGWERKRGLLNQFNDYILGKIKNPFRINTFEPNEIQKNKIKYIITLDSDTDLVINTGLELVGAMAHILNMPILNKEKNLVIDGHGIMQPRIGINLEACRKSMFTKIYAGSGGIDSYTNAISDIYQDNFQEGIFTGKGIYDLEVFSKVLENEIPENTVLSHDLLEGCYLRCGLVSDIMLMDGYPTTYNAFKTRLHRWIRGDYQILKWIHHSKFNILSKFKIIDNIIRSQIEVFSILVIIIASILKIFYNIKIWPIILIIIISNIIPTILEILNKIIFKKDGQKMQKTFTKTLSGVKASIIRAVISIAVLPDKAYMSLNAACKTIYRICESKKHLLEWTTAEEAEKNAKTDIVSYYKNMGANIVFSVLAIVFCVQNFSVGTGYWSFVFAILWLTAPYIMWQISKPITTKQIEIQQCDYDYLMEIGRRTWEFFKENLTQKHNYLPPDNYQADRKPQIIVRTSPTNIGLAILAVISSYDLKYESLENTLNLLEKMVNTIEKLPKWNGHLYNWYDIENLKPVMPQYVSSVDSGNFVGYLYILKQFLIEYCNKTNADAVNDIQNPKKYLIHIVENLINNTDFKKLYNEKNRLFSIGFNVEENKLTDSYYDLLASEARQTSLIAIAKKDITAKHWYNLSRTLTILNKYKGLISWSGTAFEYLMPTINIPQYAGSLLDESSKFMIMSQKDYAKKLGIPWGISESAFNLKDLNNNYQYKAFGIPWLGLKRGLADEIVVSSYGSVLGLNIDENKVIQNIKILEDEGMLDKFGLYESIDYTPTRVEKGQKNANVKTYMAHHQGLILASINNFFNNKIFQKRFMENPEMQAIDILLQERMPENVIIAKEKKEKIEKIKYKDYENYTQRVYTKPDEILNKVNLISNNDYSIVINQKGEGYSKYKDKLINRYKSTSDSSQGIFFFIKNIKTKKVWNSGYAYSNDKKQEEPDKYVVSFMADKNKFARIDGNIETITQITTGINEPVEIRRMQIKNNGNSEELLEITTMLEPVLSSATQDYAHMAFNNLFLKIDYLEEKNIIIAKRKARAKSEKDLFVGAKLCTQGEIIGDYEFEISKEKFFGRGNFGIPKAVATSKPFSKKIGLTTDPIIAIKRNIKLNPKEKAIFDLIICVSENKDYVIETIDNYSNTETVKRTFELSKARIEEETRYLQLTGKNIELYQRILAYLLFKNVLKKDIKENAQDKSYKIENLWKYGISGDLPILLIKIKNINDIRIVEELIKAYEFYRAKNLKIDLVILNEEKESYENYVQEAIQEAIYNRNIAYLQNIKGGIFVLKNIPNQDKKMLETRANIWFDSHLGNIKVQLDEMEEEYLEKNKVELIECGENEQISEVKENKLLDKDLKYYNEYGGFTSDGSEYKIRINSENKLPTVWSHILANDNFGTLITENLGGYSWYKNSKLNRITAWSNDQIQDTPSEIIFLKDEESSKIWSLGANPIIENDDYYITYGFGYAKYSHISNSIEQELEIFVPTSESVKINLMHLKNTLPKKKRIKMYYCIKPVLGEDELITEKFIQCEFNKNTNCVFARNIVNYDYNNVVCLSSSEKITNVHNCKITGNCIEVIENIKNHNHGDSKIINLKNGNFIMCELEIELEAFENKDISISLGVDENTIACQAVAYKYSNINNCFQEYDKTKKYWKNLLNKVQVQTPLESMNIILNGWNLYQTLASRIIGRTGFYQSGGAYGFRDQLQDSICLKYVDSELIKKQIIKHSNHQFIQGDVEHWWHDETQRGIRTRFSDDLLWLPYLVEEYINYTGDYSILNVEAFYLDGKELPEGIDENYDKYEQSQIKGDVFEHCVRAIERCLKCEFGENGLPKIGSGDWNDGFSTVGNKGKGESIWLGFFLYDILQKFLDICEYKDELELKDKYKNIAEKLKKSLNTNGWDGRWYRRAYMDNGEVLGSIENEECRIDSIAQSWATISKAGDNDKKYISIESLENHLVDKENGIIKLLDPPFENGTLEPGYIKSYLAGTRENGGQYTHAAIWAIIAEAMLGFGNKATELFRMINPIEHARTKAEAQKYKVEPYVIPGDVYGQGNLAGRGGWTWYTGSSSWMYEAGLKYILGLQIEKGFLKINPCIPNDWKEYTIRFNNEMSIYNITIKNPHSKNTGIEKFILNGNEVKEKQVKLSNNNEIYEIEIIM